MTDDETDLADAVDRFLEEADATFDQYERGYADADATVSVLRSHADDLRDAFEEERARE
ncbi:hypothetical protein SAMN04488066_105136 [Halorubrum aquaticum]|uniref:Uncharacterized protein n=1 Tax=Halorubrum aquaticum TaxID=387340 RepID=A0A1I3AEB3_9EURY|nr:hypothetical protein [Halorubrum aquaticum]SFH48447.1 hypothetical protein SAMN04488066_105136 [Halorubrum aquaticum]